MEAAKFEVINIKYRVAYKINKFTKVNAMPENATLPLIVAAGNGLSLFGRNWLQEIKMDWNMIKAVKKMPDIKPQNMSEFSELFSKNLGNVKVVKANVPLAIREKVELELNRLVKIGVLEKVDSSDWASPIIQVNKPNGCVRICGDFKATVCPSLNPKEYPMPTAEEIFTNLRGGQKFSKLDINAAYLQIELDDESKELLCDFGIHLNLDKCEFFANKVEYLSFVLSAKGIEPNPQKVEAVMNMPRPRNRDKLLLFLGMVNYYRTVILEMATLCYSLNDLLKSDVVWLWSEKCECAFQKLKESLSGEKLLMHFNPQLPVISATNGSPRGISAVISHAHPDGSERRIAYTSRSLSKAETHYSQI
ncbi:hypothetical protein QYM36_012534 [Artemia franciscana]|uniref:RNA-directed DNA polymerase n=1 Tax=Artemia franciscana TaxID=6661 RepID=A0AA88HHG7_ARTSF|nr:hypothetical protein QYM36_012534 [Artemia franciscana]